MSGLFAFLALGQGMRLPLAAASMFEKIQHQKQK